MQCSACATYALRGFLKALINVEVQITKPRLPSKEFAISTRHIHNSSTTHFQASCPDEEDRFILEQADSSNPNNTHLPDHEGLKPMRSRDTINAKPRKLPHSSIMQSSARNSLSSNIFWQEHTIGSPSMLLACSEPQTEAFKVRSSTQKTQGLETSVEELTGSNSKIKVPSSANSRVTSKSTSTSGLVQEVPLAFEHGVKATPTSSNTTGFSSLKWRPKALENAQYGTGRNQTQREQWQIQKKALEAKFGSADWTPRKRLSPDALEGIRALHAQYPHKYTTPVLADQFRVSPEVVRRILKSKWRATEEEEAERRQRWDRRGAAIWSRMVEIGIKPPKKWRDMGIGRGRDNLREGRSKRSRASAWDSGNASIEKEAGLDATLSDRIL